LIKEPSFSTQSCTNLALPVPVVANLTMAQSHYRGALFFPDTDRAFWLLSEHTVLSQPDKAPSACLQVVVTQDAD